MQILSKGSTLNQPEASKKNYQGHPINLLVKETKSNDFEFSNTSEERIKKILLSLDTSKVAGMDQIPAKFLRDGAQVLALPLRNIINLSIKLSTFSKECKIDKLKPIFKKRSRTDPQNYHPISLLPLVSKIIEKPIPFQIEEYLNKKKLIYIYQSGFRTNHSPKPLSGSVDRICCNWYR